MLCTSIFLFRLYSKLYNSRKHRLLFIAQGGPKSGTLLVFDFPTVLVALYLQCWFTYVLLSLNDLFIT